MKKFLSTITILALILPLTIQTASAQFSDLFKNNKNYTAIVFLEENNIISGYPDNTFRPYNEINRAEFLKIILEGSNIPLDKNNITLPFSDTQNTEWYLPYVKKAYDSGWIVGYDDGTFKPDQTIKKAEALKILGEVQQWKMEKNSTSTQYQDVDLNEWYAKYVVYANEHNYLEKDGELFDPIALMSRANISEIIYRTIIDNDTTVNEDTAISEEISEDNEDNEDNTEPTETFDPVIYKEIPIDFYDNITLNQPLPNTFYKNEIYVIEGEVSTNNYKEVSIFFNNDMFSNTDYQLFIGEVENRHFEIPVHFRETGNYTIGVIPGTNGNTKIEEISVLNSLPSSTSNNSPTGSIENLSINYKNDMTVIGFTAPSNSIKIFTFEQGANSVKFISRQDRDSFPLHYPTFEYFTEGDVTYFGQIANTNTTPKLEITSSYSKTPEKSFKATQHTYAQIEEGKITTSIPDTLTKFKDISINGTTKTDIQAEGLVIKPDGLVDVVSLETTGDTSTYYDSIIIENGNDFSFDYETSGSGRYIVEILDNNGIPVVNHPIYLGETVPLIPDYFDLNERSLFSGILDINALREELLSAINKERSVYGYPKVELDPELNSIAQNHSEDMTKNNFFGHINLENQTPDDRRLEAKITTPVSENIAKDVSVIFGHLGLMRSGSHRENILNPDWYLVGLGIAETGGYLYITEEFSAKEITANDLIDYENELIDAINALREANGIAPFIYQDNSKTVCAYLNDETISENIILTIDDLSTALELYNISGTSQYISRTYNVWDVILSSILNDEESSILDESWVNIGIDIQLDATGIIHASFMLNK
ncbi:MAG: hypothetical protein GWP15_01725 [Nitrospirae bacterium]|nr:hypothetical protein [Nitrospirota bacterium]